MELFWQRRLLAAFIVACYGVYDIIVVTDEPSIKKGENATTNSIEVVTAAMTNSTPSSSNNNRTIKVPTCAIPPNSACVKPYFTPETVACANHANVRIDDSGAWYLPENFMYKFDQSIANAILDRVITGDVLELGAGLGCYTHYFQDSKKITSITGYEGAANVEEMSEGFIHQADLTKKQDFGGMQYDWVLCMEVAEHIPPQFQYMFLLNVLSPATKGVVLTWGIPGQSGRGHVNLRTNDYVIDLMRGIGFDYDAGDSQYLRDEALSSWFKNSAMVFRKRDLE